MMDGSEAECSSFCYCDCVGRLYWLSHLPPPPPSRFDVAVRAKFSRATSVPRTRLEPPLECCLHRNTREYELISQILPELTLLARRPVGPRRPATWLSPEGAPKREPEVGKVLHDRHS